MGARMEKKGCKCAVVGWERVVSTKGVWASRSISWVESSPARARSPSKAKASRDGMEVCFVADGDGDDGGGGGGGGQ